MFRSSLLLSSSSLYRLPKLRLLHPLAPAVTHTAAASNVSSISPSYLTKDGNFSYIEGTYESNNNSAQLSQTQVQQPVQIQPRQIHTNANTATPVSSAPTASPSDPPSNSSSQPVLHVSASTVELERQRTLRREYLRCMQAQSDKYKQIKKDQKMQLKLKKKLGASSASSPPSDVAAAISSAYNNNNNDSSPERTATEEEKEYVPHRNQQRIWRPRSANRRPGLSEQKLSSLPPPAQPQAQRKEDYHRRTEETRIGWEQSWDRMYVIEHPLSLFSPVYYSSLLLCLAKLTVVAWSVAAFAVLGSLPRLGHAEETSIGSDTQLTRIHGKIQGKRTKVHL